MKQLKVRIDTDKFIILPNKDYIPCKRKSDGAVGIYDVEAKKFHEYKETQPIDEWLKGE